MQAELEAEHPEIHIELLAVNLAGLEDGVEGMAASGTLPILQDTAAVGAWNLWSATWRDVVVLDGKNQRVAVYNLTEHDLGNADNYRALAELLASTAP